MPWKPEHAENRRKRIAADPEYAKRYYESASRAASSRDPEYMRKYYAENKHKWNKRDPAKRIVYNAARRDQYAADPAFRARMLAEVKAWQEANPEKRKTQRLRKYGITLAEFKRLLAEQSGGCGICRRPVSADRDARSGKPRGLSVDHCHATGIVRGILCSACNLGIGKFGDNPELLDRAAVYLRKAHIATAKSPRK